LDFRSCWIVFIHIVQGCRGGLLQFSKHEAAKIFLASASSGICTMWLNREKSCAWATAKRCGCSVVPLTASFHTWWYHLIHNSFPRHHWLRASGYIMSPWPKFLLNFKFLFNIINTGKHYALLSSTHHL